MPRQTRKARKESQPQPRQVRAEEATPASEEYYDELLDEFVADEDEEAQLEPDQAREEEKSVLVEESPEEQEREQLAYYESLPKLLTSSELGEVLSINRTTVYSWRLVGFLPEPIRVLPQIGAVWLRDEIRVWLRNREWADNDRARKVYSLFKEHGEDINEWISPKPGELDYLPATVPVGIGEQNPIRCEQTDAALDEIDRAFDGLERLRGSKYEIEALALIANRLAYLNQTATTVGVGDKHEYD